jgi:multidrug efflux system membrane fusion protein
MKRFRWVLPLLACTAVITACSDGGGADVVRRPVKLHVVENGKVEAHREYAGEVRARVESSLGFRVSGKIASRSVDAGERVKKGQVLAKLDREDERLRYDSARARFNSTRADMELAETSYQRVKELHENGHVSEAELDRARIALDSARAAREQARAALNRARNRLAYTKLQADADGVVVAVNADVGEVVSVGRPVIRLAHDGPREVAVDIPEHRLEPVRKGSAKVTLWADKDQWYPASLRELDADGDPVTRTFTAWFTVEAPEDALALGQSATVRLTLPKRSQGARVPTTSVIRQDDASAVWVFDEEKSVMRRHPVRIRGVEGNDLIVEGLEAGTRVAEAGVHVIREGQPVRPLGEQAPSNNGGL